MYSFQCRQTGFQLRRVCNIDSLLTPPLLLRDEDVAISNLFPAACAVVIRGSIRAPIAAARKANCVAIHNENRMDAQEHMKKTAGNHHSAPWKRTWKRTRRQQQFQLQRKHESPFHSILPLIVAPVRLLPPLLWLRCCCWRSQC